jgi:hypothetical protein
VLPTSYFPAHIFLRRKLARTAVLRGFDTLLHRIVFFGPAAKVGQFPPPGFVAGMEELASIPDTSGVRQVVGAVCEGSVECPHPRKVGD